MADDLDRALARSGYVYAVGQVVRLGTDAERQLATAALDKADPETIRALLAVAPGTPWRDNVIDALAQIGVIAAEEIMHG
ncbi:hypothetical protein [Devosia sp. 1566]|uniref:hypothetical protein n=1 Tax=Devosia sp. 1566 TaxID=2499144 RepID=UPI000FDCD507|nr:hypothetical protein [Devosia sp. 1566]